MADTMRIAVTGAAGFIGSTLTDRLLEMGHQVVAIDNFDDYYSGKMRFLEPHLNDPRFSLHRESILDIDAMRRCFEGAEVVYHLAAQAGVRISVKDPMRSHQANATGTLAVLIAARDVGVRRVVSSSSSSVYGNAKVLPVNEDMPLRPVSPYAASKLAAEDYCRLFYELYGLQTVSLRYFTVYGPRQRPDMAIRIFTDRALKGLRPQIFGDGEQTRDFTYIDDVVEAVIRCGSCPDPKGGALNICSGRTVTVNQVVESILKATGREDLTPEYLPPQPGDVDHTWGDNRKARELLGWAPKVTIEEGIERFVEWYRGMKELHDQIK
ncbi:MAG: GDP-mannose 4,6-dehydratase [Methanomassiliicoccales archaeon]|nr:MAG: GDP-mannose 4,6-dehydratase [Methanomassiliicoccales archaeon]